MIGIGYTVCGECQPVMFYGARAEIHASDNGFEIIGHIGLDINALPESGCLELRQDIVAVVCIAFVFDITELFEQCVCGWQNMLQDAVRVVHGLAVLQHSHGVGNVLLFAQFGDGRFVRTASGE